MLAATITELRMIEVMSMEDYLQLIEFKTIKNANG